MKNDRRTFAADGGAGSGADGGGTGGGNVPPPAPIVPPAAWHAGVEPEVLGHWQNNNWDLTSPLAVATAATKAAREAAQFAGAPPSELIRIPKAGDEAGARAMWQRLGTPSDPTGYDLTGIKFADGTALDDGFVAHFRTAAHKFNLPKDQAVGLAQEVVRFMEQAESADNQAAIAKNMEQSTLLRTNWGNKFDLNMHVAREAALKLGYNEAEIDSLQKTVGYAKTMEHFRQLGMSTGEGRFIEGGQGSGGVYTKDQAVSKKADLMKDQAWVGRYLKGGMAEKNEMTQLNTVIVGEDDTARFRGY